MDSPFRPLQWQKISYLYQYIMYFTPFFKEYIMYFEHISKCTVHVVLKVDIFNHQTIKFLGKKTG